MSANELSNALLAGGIGITSATPGSNRLAFGSWGLLGMERIGAGQYLFELEQELADSVSTATGFAIATQKSGTSALYNCSVVPTGETHAGKVLLETFARATGLAIDVEGAFSLLVLRAPIG